MLSSLLTLLIIGLAAVVGVAVVLALLGAAMTLVGFLLFKVAPLILIGYVITKLIGRRQARLSHTDREWLEG